LRPDSAEAWSSLGLTYVMAWRWKNAWIALSKAKRRDPLNAEMADWGNWCLFMVAKARQRASGSIERWSNTRTSE
jgi:cytochrome c-type biogenesis protein CcmH/NrfG